mmetsp:Transcript_13312/g.16180  ORF Transcript_13312/g.16180 Transcript_13312/m.16180 type:complete len:196 (-) Transcript_13312:691-1278(-)
MYLQVTTLSDIVDGNGKTITRSALKGEIDHTRPKHYVFPKQARPYDKAWTLWKSAIKKCYKLRQGDIADTLGYWMDGERDQWTWFYQSGNNHLYQRFGNMWKLYTRPNRRVRLGRKSKFRYASNAMTLPRGCRRARTVCKVERNVVNSLDFTKKDAEKSTDQLRWEKNSYAIFSILHLKPRPNLSKLFEKTELNL